MQLIIYLVSDPATGYPERGLQLMLFNDLHECLEDLLFMLTQSDVDVHTILRGVLPHLL